MLTNFGGSQLSVSLAVWQLFSWFSGGKHLTHEFFTFGRGSKGDYRCVHPIAMCSR